MRTLVDLPKPDLDQLTKLAEERGVSRAALMREALKNYLDRNRPEGLTQAFGLWATGEDGLTYQERMRGEW